jgi:hypothetical protein
MAFTTARHWATRHLTILVPSFAAALRAFLGQRGTTTSEISARFILGLDLNGCDTRWSDNSPPVQSRLDEESEEIRLLQA